MSGDPHLETVPLRSALVDDFAGPDLRVIVPRIDVRYDLWRTC